MKKFKDISEFENLLKSELTNHSVPTPPDVWSAVSSSVGGNSAGVISQITNYLSSVTNILKVAFFAGGISAVGITLYTSNTEKPTPFNDALNNKVEEVISTPTEEQDEISQDKETLVANSIPKTVSTEKLNLETKAQRFNSVDNNLPNKKTQFDEGITPIVSKKNDIHNQTKLADPSIALALFASNTTPCKGEVVNLSNTRKEKGTWLENGKVIAQNVADLKYKCNNEGVINISFQGTEQLANSVIRVQTLKASIISNEGIDGNYTLALSNKNLSANWYIDGKVIALNAKETSTKILGAGKHTIKAIAVNQACSAEFNSEITVKSKNSIEIFDIFTPDGDGKNDFYVVKIENYEYFSIRIFDRENGLVFESQNPNIQWDGRIQTSGIECPNGEYIAKLSYKLIGEDPKLKNLKITLIRD